MEPGSDRCRLRGRGVGRFPVSTGEVSLHRRQEEVPGFDAVGRAFQKPRAPGEPAVRWPRLPGAGEAEAKPEGGAHGAGMLSEIAVRTVAALQSRQTVLV